ncbi:MAG TPA: STAS domain-containing protein [Solirubrobacteraceae bacterium]
MPNPPTRRSQIRGRELELHGRIQHRRPCRPRELESAEPRGVRGRFRIAVEHLGSDSVAITLAGELDLAALPALDGALRRAERLTPATVFVDAGDVGFVDLSVVRRLAAAHERLQQAHDGELLVVHPPDCLLRILEVLEDLELVLLP